MEDKYTKPHTFNTKLRQRHHYNFMNKAIIFAIFVFIIPLFSPQSSETTGKFVNWELIQLILVGIAVSYGLFTRKNDESEEKLDNLNSYLSNIFHIPSFPDENTDKQCRSNENDTVEMRKNEYLRKDPLVVIEKETNVMEKSRSVALEIGEKPLFLPVRNLKAMNIETDETSSLYHKAKVEEVCFPQSSTQCDSKSDSSAGIKKDNSNANAPVLPFPSLSRSFESKPCSTKNKNEIFLKGANVGKSVRTFRTCELDSGELENVGNLEEKGNDLVNEKRASLKVFDYRDYEKEVNYKIEGFKCNNEIGEVKDVDKKADEFIAKFKEQIRLQKIELFRK